MKEYTRLYHCCLSEAVQEWIVEQDDNGKYIPIQPTREKNKNKWFSIYRDGKTEFAISPMVKTALLAVIHEYMVDNKDKKNITPQA